MAGDFADNKRAAGWLYCLMAELTPYTLHNIIIALNKYIIEKVLCVLERLDLEVYSHLPGDGGGPFDK